MIKDLSWLKISDVFAPNIRQISWNKVIIYEYPDIRNLGAGTVPVPGTYTCNKIAKHRNIRSANPLICCKIAKYPNIRSANPLICCKIAKYPISDSDILYPNGAAKVQNIPKYIPWCWHGLYLRAGIWEKTFFTLVRSVELSSWTMILNPLGTAYRAYRM